MELKLYNTLTRQKEVFKPIDKNIALVRNLTDRGIVNTICSKNDVLPVEKELNGEGCDDLFVFKSIDWTPKGQRISHLIKASWLNSLVAK